MIMPIAGKYDQYPLERLKSRSFHQNIFPSSYVEENSSVIQVRNVVLGLQSERTRCSIGATLKSLVSAEMHFVPREMYSFSSFEFFCRIVLFSVAISLYFRI